MAGSSGPDDKGIGLFEYGFLWGYQFGWRFSLGFDSFKRVGELCMNHCMVWDKELFVYFFSSHILYK